MLINLKTSEANKIINQELARKMNLGSDNHVARIAFAYSISKDIYLDLEKTSEIARVKNIRTTSYSENTAIIISPLFARFIICTNQTRTSAGI
jgi:hypothetical protein